MGLFSNQNAPQVVDKKSPAYAVRMYRIARINLLTAIILTVVNIVLDIIGANIYLLFSIAFPYWMFDPADLLWSVPAILVLALYVVYFVLSKKKSGFMIAAMVTFVLDFLFLIGYSLILSADPDIPVTVADFLIDYVTHIWVLVYLVIGTRYAKRYQAAVREDPSLLIGSGLQPNAVPVRQNPEDPAASEDAAWTNGQDDPTDHRPE